MRYESGLGLAEFRHQPIHDGPNRLADENRKDLSFRGGFADEESHPWPWKRMRFLAPTALGMTVFLCVLLAFGVRPALDPRPRCYRVAAITIAVAAVSRLAYGTCKNSFGPCALDFGPSTPVTSICALGNIAPSMPMKGMVPPSPR